MQWSIVFRPSSVEGPSSEFWPGHRVLTRSFGSIFFNQNDAVLVKKNKSQQVATEFFTGSYRVNRVAGSHRVFSSPVFSSTRSCSSPRLAKSWVDLPSRVSKLCNEEWKAKTKKFKTCIYVIYFYIINAYWIWFLIILDFFKKKYI
jgi:hypothetical protein